MRPNLIAGICNAGFAATNAVLFYLAGHHWWSFACALLGAGAAGFAAGVHFMSAARGIAR